jgi:la-related protein 1
VDNRVFNMAASSVKQTPISYAQAAKGLATTSSAQQNKPAATPASPPKDMTSSAVFADGSSADPATTTTLVASVNGTADHGPKSQQSFDLDAKKSISRPVSPDAVHTGSAGIMSPQEDDLSTTPNGTSESTWDKQSQVSSSVDRSSQATEASKDKPMENGWDKSPVPVKELKEAPIPAVNVWQQRLAAQEAKLAKTKSATPAGAPASNTTTAAKPPAAGSISHSVPDSKPVSKKKPSEAAAENAGSPNKKKPVEGAKPKSDGKSIFPKRLPIFLHPLLTLSFYSL